MPLLFGGGAVILIEDTRNQVGKHKNVESYCRRMGIEIVRQKLDVGDYAFPDGKISVDTKQDIMELFCDAAAWFPTEGICLLTIINDVLFVTATFLTVHSGCHYWQRYHRSLS